MDTDTASPAAAGLKIGKDVAEAEFHKFAEAMDLDLDESKMDGEDEEEFREARQTFTDAVVGGNLVVNATGEPVFTPKLGDTSAITFHEPSGATVMARDTKKSGHDVAKMFASMADMTETSMSRFSSMKRRDLKICSAIFVLFMGG